jgi:HAD superfamily hydrolase (TIGR01509 family)
MNLASFDTIIFDLGGVVINLDYHKTTRAFEAIGLENFEEMYSQAAQSGLFDDFEKGKSSVPYFVNKLLDFLPSGTSANQVVEAWNEMILDFPIQNLQLLEKLKSSHRTFLLSNTNEIHIQKVHQHLQLVSEHKTLHPYFEKVYFSSDIKMRKPDSEIFEFVLKENGLNPKKTLFIDDTEQHILGAQKVGIQTYHLQKGESICEVLR